MNGATLHIDRQTGKITSPSTRFSGTVTIAAFDEANGLVAIKIGAGSYWSGGVGTIGTKATYTLYRIRNIEHQENRIVIETDSVTGCMSWLVRPSKPQFVAVIDYSSSITGVRY